MKTYLSIPTYIFIFFFAAPSISAQDVTKAHKDSLNIVIKKYYDLNLKVFQANSTKKDIENIFEIFTEDFEYVHPKYGGTYTRDVLYNGYAQNQKNGGYDGTITDIEIPNKIIGLNAVVVQKRFIKNENGKVVKGKPEMTLFEFKKGKISKIYEYW